MKAANAFVDWPVIWAKAAEQMLTGLYRLKFRSGAEEGAGICVFKDGHIAGGGSVMYYLGRYQLLDSSHFTAEIEAKRHAKKNKPSPVMGLDEFHMSMEGVFSGPYAQVVGHIREVPSAVLLANLSRLSELSG